MFNLFRSREKSVRIVLGVLLGLICLSMLTYLGGSFTGVGAGGQNTIATVGGDQITIVDVERQAQRMTQNQPNLPKGLMAMYVQPLINQLIESKAMALKANEMGIRVTDQELGDSIQQQYSSSVGTAFDPALYQRIVESQGMTVPAFEKQQRELMLVSRLEALETQAIVITDQQARAEYARKNLKVGLEYIDFSEKPFESKVNKDPALVKKYFDSNRLLFRSPEKRDGTVIVGSTADFLQMANVTEAQLRQAYQDNHDSYLIPERVRVRHILIKTQGKPKEQAPALKAKADDLMKQIQHGGDFAELAKKNSEDPGSAVKGGELGWLVHGQTVPNFDKAAFSLGVGQTSGVIETEYGYHILQLEEKQNAHTQTFEEVRPQLEADLRKQAAAANLKRATDSAHAEIVKNPSQADSIAKKYGLRAIPFSGLTSASPLPDGNAPEVVNAIFSASKGAVTDVSNLDAQGKTAFAVVTNVQPARNADFQDVQNDVLQKYTQAEAARLSQDAAKAAADRLKKGESLEAVAKSYGLDVKTAAPFTIDGAAEGIGSATLLQAAFKDKVGDVLGPIAAQNGQFVCRVSQIMPADMSQFAANKDAIIQSLTEQRQSIQGTLFRASVLDQLKRKGKIKLNQENINRLIQSYQS
ncbi:MAG TPA: peptidyl-prolyl cis-trans isomerase [Bryobacteraceae bacterium]|jgi:peptidyl-prolyl cis-trans isomerase D|nr:peptidyl-prolyl cis-trans isomerase [Bryobacteraceae bacterium]